MDLTYKNQSMIDSFSKSRIFHFNQSTPVEKSTKSINRDLHAKQFCTMRYENKQYISLAVIEVEERETPRKYSRISFVR